MNGDILLLHVVSEYRFMNSAWFWLQDIIGKYNGVILRAIPLGGMSAWRGRARGCYQKGLIIVPAGENKGAFAGQP